MGFWQRLVVWFVLVLAVGQGYLMWASRLPPLLAVGVLALIQVLLLEGVLIPAVWGHLSRFYPDLDRKRTRAWVGLGLWLPPGWFLLFLEWIRRPGKGSPVPKLIQRPFLIPLLVFPVIGLLTVGSKNVGRLLMNPVSFGVFEIGEEQDRINGWSRLMENDPESYATVEQRWKLYGGSRIGTSTGLVQILAHETALIQKQVFLSPQQQKRELFEISLLLWERYQRDWRTPPYGNPLVLSGYGGVEAFLLVWLESSLAAETAKVLRQSLVRLSAEIGDDPALHMEELRARFAESFREPG